MDWYYDNGDSKALDEWASGILAKSFCVQSRIVVRQRLWSTILLYTVQDKDGSIVKFWAKAVPSMCATTEPGVLLALSGWDRAPEVYAVSSDCTMLLLPDYGPTVEVEKIDDKDLWVSLLTDYAHMQLQFGNSVTAVFLDKKSVVDKLFSDSMLALLEKTLSPEELPNFFRLVTLT